MKLREDILNELNAISNTVATVPFVNVFTVNADYFDGIEIELKAKIFVDRMIGLQNNFDVPLGYFDNLSSVILKKIKLTENDVFAETTELSALIAGIGNSNIFATSQNDFDVPAGYFDNLTSVIFKNIKLAENDVFVETTEISPLIAGIGNHNVFTVPKYYFEQIAFTNQEKPAAKVVQMSRSRGVFKYIAAAVITGLLGLSIVNIVDKSESVTVAQITTDTTEVMNTADTILKNGTFETALAAVSDNDIEHYLQQGGQDVNAALVAASTDETDKLPEATEYLLDENTLKNYLDENNLKK